MVVSSQVIKQSAQRFLKFVDKTGSPYHTVWACREVLTAAGFNELRESDSKWQVQKGGKYFVTRNGASIVAFVVGKRFDPTKSGLAMIGAHTDSPCLRVRPNSNMEKHGFKQVGVATYGGGLWHTWFDRPLGMAGKVVVRDGNQIKEELLAIRDPLMVIPNLAIHLNTADERAAFKVNTETHLQPIFCSKIKDEPEHWAEGTEEPAKKKPKVDKSASRHHAQLLKVMAKELGAQAEDIIEFDMCLMDTMPGCFVGPYDELISSPRIDNVASTWACMEAIVDADVETTEDILVAASFDHEEIGSSSLTGADSNNLPAVIDRVFSAMSLSDVRSEVISRSLFFSVDMAHAQHPNYAEKHQSEHKVAMHDGVVIKYNHNQRYATNTRSAAITREIGKLVDCPVQNFVVRNDCACGSTIGPMLASRMGVRTVDLGCTQWGMHSCRETCSSDDLHHLLTFCKGAYAHLREVDSRCFSCL